MVASMLRDIGLLFQHIADWPVWEQFRFSRAQVPSSGSIFGLAEYLASLALFLVVMTTSDFRYTYRLALTRTNLRKLGFWVGLGIGIAILLTDVWFENRLPVPKLISNSNNLKALLGLVYLTFVFRVIFVAVIRRPTFTKANAKEFFESNYHLIHQGNPDRLQVIAEELRGSMESVFALAAKVSDKRGEGAGDRVPHEQAYANSFILLIGDERFCRTVVDKVPAFALYCFLEAQKNMRGRLPIFQFARNIGQEFIRNTNSSFYQENSGYYSGLVGYDRPVTKVIFGSYEFVERCASDGASPIDTDYREFGGFSAQQMEGYSRASLAFFESYLFAHKDRLQVHSYAMARMLDSFESSVNGLYRMDGVKDFIDSNEYQRLKVTVDFINGAIALVDKHAAKPRAFRISNLPESDIYDDLARLIFDVIFAASTVSSPESTAWSFQYEAVWGEIFSINRSAARKIIALKVRRLLFTEIKRMDHFANFKGAHILGFCLNVLGLKLIDRHNDYRKEFYPLQAAALRWTEANYLKLVADHPKVAEACLQGSISYDADNHRLVKTFSGATEPEPDRDYLNIY
jgi:hypothetical protein